MKSGRCPKCSSTNVFFRDGAGDRGALIVAFFSFARLRDYVCVDCGYVESYVRDKAKLEIIKSRWNRFGSS